MIFVVLLHILNSCIIGQVFTETSRPSNIILNPQNKTKNFPTDKTLKNNTHPNSDILSLQHSFSSENQEDSINAQNLSNNRYKINDVFNKNASTFKSNQLSDPTLDHISSITNSLDNDLYYMSFMPEELMDTKFPHNISRDIDMDPCKSGKVHILICYYFHSKYQNMSCRG